MGNHRGISKPKPRWDVHLPGAGNRGGSLAGVFRPLIAGPSGSAVSPRLSGWTARPGICRHAPAPPPWWTSRKSSGPNATTTSRSTPTTPSCSVAATQVVPPLTLSPTDPTFEPTLSRRLPHPHHRTMQLALLRPTPRERTKRYAGPRIMSGVSIYPTLLVTTITIAASSAWTRRTNGTCLLNA